tara:strand:- start:787 stop:1215 length:429 start_codon:yes stop_codon:yes gene_type:complete
MPYKDPLKQKEYQHNHNKRYSERRRELRIKNWDLQKFQKIRYRAKKEGIHFSITAKYIKSMYPEDGLCPVFKKPFVFGELSEWNLSVDRIIPELGYREGNIILVSKRANTMKSNAEVKDIVKLGSFYTNLLKEKECTTSSKT